MRIVSVIFVVGLISLLLVGCVEDGETRERTLECVTYRQSDGGGKTRVCKFLTDWGERCLLFVFDDTIVCEHHEFIIKGSE
jgi:hypothetical protein